MTKTNELKLDKLIKYLEVLSTLYFAEDPLKVKQNIDRVTFLIEMEFNKIFDGGEKVIGYESCEKCGVLVDDGNIKNGEHLCHECIDEAK